MDGNEVKTYKNQKTKMENTKSKEINKIRERFSEDKYSITSLN